MGKDWRTAVSWYFSILYSRFVFLHVCLFEAVPLLGGDGYDEETTAHLVE